MKDLSYDTDDPIAALATPWGESALAVIRTTGKNCLAVFAPFFSRPKALLESPGGRVLYGMMRGSGSEVLDEVTVAVHRAPKSYTGQDSVEIFCHGSLPGLRRILETLTTGGFRPAGPGEFTMRAFLNGKMDLTRAEAVAEVIGAKSVRAQSLALHRLGGAVEGVIDGVKKKLLDLVSLLNIQLDYAEDDVEDLDLPLSVVEEASRDLIRLRDTYRAGRVYQEGVRVVLAGKTNAGKSSLFNLFLKEDRSIVSEEHGTTRDYLESWVSLAGIPMRLYDTAGLREADNLVEKEGIRRSERIIENSQLVLYLVDGQAGIMSDDQRFLERFATDDRLVRIWNKSDLAPDAPAGWISLSAVTGQGFEDLEKRLEQAVLGARPLSPGEPVIDSLRQKELLDRAVASLENVKLGVDSLMPLDLLALDVKEAMDALGEITGEITTAEVLDNMFGNFCVGK